MPVKRNIANKDGTYFITFTCNNWLPLFNGKRFIAYDIVKKLQEQQQVIVLQQLSNAKTETEIKNNKKHKVFETSFDWNCCDSEKFMEQKLNYLHSNPCKGKWHLAKTPIDDWHSSAKFYLTGLEGVFIVKHYKSLADE